MRPERLYAWRSGQCVGLLQAQGSSYGLAEGPEDLATALAALQAKDYLPLTIRKDVGTNRSITMKRLAPGEEDYWRALAEALTRQLGVELKTTPG